MYGVITTWIIYTINVLWRTKIYEIWGTELKVRSGNHQGPKSFSSVLSIAIVIFFAISASIQPNFLIVLENDEGIELHNEETNSEMALNEPLDMEEHPSEENEPHKGEPESTNATAKEQEIIKGISSHGLLSSSLSPLSSSTAYSAFPDDDPDSGKFLGVAGSGTLTNVPIICHIGVPSGETSFDLDIFDGDISDHWDQYYDDFDYMDFMLYEDPLKDGTGSTLVASWTHYSMTNDDWYNQAFSTTVGAQAPSGNYFYRLEVQWRNPGLSSSNNYFKIRTTGQLSFAKGDQFAFMAGPMRIPYPAYYDPAPWESQDLDPPVWAGDPDPSVNNVDANSYDGDWEFFFYIPKTTNELQFKDGDCDYRYDASSPGNPADGPSPYDGCNINYDIYYTITDPNGIAYNNYDPSGDMEWETFQITGTLPPGLWEMLWQDVDAHNMNFIEASYEIFTTPDPPLPVSPPPEVVPDNSATVMPGITIDYAHSVTNRGIAATYDLVAVSNQGWTTRIYHDANGNGILEQAEINAGVITSTGLLAKDEVFHIIVQVDVPPTATNGQIDVTTVTASSQDEWNIQDSASDTTTVIANNPPIADADGPYLGDETHSIQLNGSGSYDPDGDALSYAWDLDNDGAYDDSTSVSPTYVWNEDGTYTVGLEVYDGEYYDYDNATVYVNDLAPTADFTWSPEPQDEGSPVQFTDLSTSYPDTIVSWNWDFGGFGNSTEQNPEFTFMDNDIYTVTLTVIDDDGSPDTAFHNITILDLAPTANFTWSPEPQDEGSPVQFTDLSTSNPDTIVSWEWDFGDSGTTWDQNPTHPYGDNGIFTVTLIVMDDDGSTDAISYNITILNVAPNVYAGEDKTIDEGATISFSGNFTDPGWLDTHTIEWDFGDGNTASGTLTPVHAYGDDGVFTVVLTITDDDGGVGYDNLTVTVKNVAPSIEPFGPFIVDEGSPLNITATCSDPGSDDLKFIWELEYGPTVTTIYYNDGAGPDPYPSSLGAFPFNASDLVSYTYGDDGVYSLTLTIVDDDNGTNTFTTTITVNNLAPHIEPFGPLTVDESSPFNITAISSDPGSDDLKFTWEFEYGPIITTTYHNDGVGPDPSPSPWGIFLFTATDSVSHTYGDNGVFLVTLTVEDDDGGTSVYSTNITVNNIAPRIKDITSYMYVNFTLRVAGEKWHSVNITLFEDDLEIWSAGVTRQPGSPDEQAATFYGYSINFGSSYRAVVDYLPNDPRVNGNVWGGNPVWIILEFQDGTTERLHHTFNVRQSYWDSDHWNHIDPWEVDLTGIIFRHNIVFEAHASDPGSDDLSFYWNFGDGYFSGPNIYYNNGSSPDPYPSPELNPMNATDLTLHSYSEPGTYTITLIVTDDDGGSATITFTLEIGG